MTPAVNHPRNINAINAQNFCCGKSTSHPPSPSAETMLCSGRVNTGKAAPRRLSAVSLMKVTELAERRRVNQSEASEFTTSSRIGTQAIHSTSIIHHPDRSS
jgi:hypothetical protein